MSSKGSQTGEGAPTLEVRAPIYYLVKFCRKMHENERNWTKRVGSTSHTPINSCDRDIGLNIIASNLLCNNNSPNYNTTNSLNKKLSYIKIR